MQFTRKHTILVTFEPHANANNQQCQLQPQPFLVYEPLLIILFGETTYATVWNCSSALHETHTPSSWAPSSSWVLPTSGPWTHVVTSDLFLIYFPYGADCNISFQSWLYWIRSKPINLKTYTCACVFKLGEQWEECGSLVKCASANHWCMYQMCLFKPSLGLNFLSPIALKTLHEEVGMTTTVKTLRMERKQDCKWNVWQ